MQANIAGSRIYRVLRVLEQRERTQAWLARKIGVTPGYVGHISAGRKPITRRFIVDCARVLDLPAEVLFDAEDLRIGKADLPNGEGEAA
jgi:transcriptional regulator with XRE-family HTH domain